MLPAQSSANFSRAADLVPRFPDVAVPPLAPVAGTSLPLPTTTTSSSSSSSPDRPFAAPFFPPIDLNLAAVATVTEPITVTMTSTATISTATLSSATATATAGMASSHDPGSPMSAAAKPTECSLLGPFAIFIQLALGALALMSLVYKRWRERPQRPVKIWFFDVSKQVFGSVLVHAANVFMSLLTSGRFHIEVDTDLVAANAAAGTAVRRAAALALEGAGLAGASLLGRAAEGAGAAAAAAGEGGGGGGSGGGGGGREYVPNPCSSYFLNLAIDTTLGIPILIIIVRVLTRLVGYTRFGKPAESIQSGNYGTPPKAWWWFKQSMIYFCGLMGMKLCVLIMFVTLPWLPHIGDWALGWTEGNEKLQIVFVMMLFPLIMNALQYYIIDSYIKKKETLMADGDASAGAGTSVVYEELAASESDGETGDDDDDDDDDNDNDQDEARKALNPGGRGSHVRLTRRESATERPTRDAEYDPAVDGDSPTVIGSSSSRISSRPALPKELLPPE